MTPTIASGEVEIHEDVGLERPQGTALVRRAWSPWIAIQIVIYSPTFFCLV